MFAKSHFMQFYVDSLTNPFSDSIPTHVIKKIVMKEIHSI